MDERDLEAEQPFAGRGVDQVGSRDLKFCERRTHIAHLVRDMVHPRPAPRQEPPDGSVVAGRLEQLDTAGPDPNRGRAHTLSVHGGLMLHLGAKQPRVRGERLVQVVDGNA